MKRALIPILLIAAFGGRPTFGQTGNPNPKNFRLSVDGADTIGVAGFEIDFEKAPDLAYSPRLVASRGSAPRLSLTLTPKGVAALSDWLNQAGAAAGPVPTRTIGIQSLDSDGNVVLEWRLDGAQPVAITQLSSGTGTPVVSVVFGFEKLAVVRAAS